MVGLTKDQIKAIEYCLNKGDRVELIPIKEGIRVVKVKRITVNTPERNRMG